MRLCNIIILFLVHTLILACGGEKRGTYIDELDPETAAEVRRINLENFAGDWLLKLPKASMYLSIDADRYYWTQHDNADTAIGADFGKIEHRLPGKMLLHSDRSECEYSDEKIWLWMDKLGNTVRLLDHDDKGPPLNLLAVEKHEQVGSLPCGIYETND